MLTSLHLHDKRKEERSVSSKIPPVSFAFIDLVTKHTNVKWPLLRDEVKWRQVAFNASVSRCTSLLSFLQSFDMNPSVDDAVDSRVIHSSTPDFYIRICHGIQKRVFIGNSASDSREQNDYGGKGEHQKNQHHSCSF